jgi:hypothetical protein
VNKVVQDVIPITPIGFNYGFLSIFTISNSACFRSWRERRDTQTLEGQSYFADWSRVIDYALKRSGFENKTARETAEEIVAGIQGVLILARFQDDPAIFMRAMKRLHQRARIDRNGQGPIIQWMGHAVLLRMDSSVEDHSSSGSSANPARVPFAAAEAKDMAWPAEQSEGNLHSSCAHIAVKGQGLNLWRGCTRHTTADQSAASSPKA